MPQEYIYDATSWLQSSFRAIKEYVETGIDNYIMAGAEASGLEAYKIVMDFPHADVPAEKWPIVEDGKPKTLIHFAIDDIENIPLGIGASEYAETITEGDIVTAGEVVPDEAECHVVNFDVGIWASDASGGSTSRLVAYEMLNKILGGPRFQDYFQERTGGIEIRSFSGGRFIVETINDIRTYRVIDAELIVRVYSRNITIPSVLVDEIEQNPSLIIGDTVIVNWE